MEILKGLAPVLIGFAIGTGIIMVDLYIIGGGYYQSWISYLFFVPVTLSFIFRKQFYKLYK